MTPYLPLLSIFDINIFRFCIVRIALKRQIIDGQQNYNKFENNTSDIASYINSEISSYTNLHTHLRLCMCCLVYVQIIRRSFPEHIQHG